MRRALLIALAALTASCRSDPAPAPSGPGPAEAPAAEAPSKASPVGDLSQLSAALRRAFDPTWGTPMPPLQDGDWLAEHEEPGQTFDEYVASRPNLPDKTRRFIYVLPVGRFDSAEAPSMEALEDFTRAFFGLEVRFLDPVSEGDLGVRSRVKSWGERKWKQLHAGDILDVLPKRLPDDAYALIAVSMTDLYPKDSWNFVFGMASLVNRVGVYSFARYVPSFAGRGSEGELDKALILSRSAGILAHETGHMFGIKHCTHFSCLMNGSNSLEESDRQPLHLCPVCLRKLQGAVGFDPVARYQRLEAWYRKHGLTEEADFAKTRRTAIETGR